MEFDVARDSILAIVSNVWGSSNKIEYPNKILSAIPSGSETWARATITHGKFGNSTLANGIGSKRFDRYGAVIVQIFTPIGTGLATSDSISKLFVDAFEGKTDSTGAIWFKDAYIKEVGISESHYQVNFICNFYYTNIK